MASRPTRRVLSWRRGELAGCATPSRQHSGPRPAASSWRTRSSWSSWRWPSTRRRQLQLQQLLCGELSCGRSSSCGAELASWPGHAHRHMPTTAIRCQLPSSRRQTRRASSHGASSACGCSGARHADANAIGTRTAGELGRAVSSAIGTTEDERGIWTRIRRRDHCSPVTCNTPTTYRYEAITAIPDQRGLTAVSQASAVPQVQASFRDQDHGQRMGRAVVGVLPLVRLRGPHHLTEAPR